MAKIQCNGKKYEVDEDGFLVRFEDWDEDWVECLRETEKIGKLNDEHRKVIAELQQCYYNWKCWRHTGITLKVDTNNMHKTIGVSFIRIWELFPSNGLRGACKMAGLKDISC